MAALLIVTGPPGAGKSTVSAILAGQSSRSVLVEGDRFFGFLAEGMIQPWLPESRHQNEIVTEAAASATGRFARDYDTVYDGVVGPWFLPTFAAATGLRELDYVVVMPTIETCVSRVRSRTGHGFTDEAATRKMHVEFEKSEIDRRHVLRGDFGAPADTARAIRSAQAAGQLRYVIGSP